MYVKYVRANIQPGPTQVRPYLVMVLLYIFKLASSTNALDLAVNCTIHGRAIAPASRGFVSIPLVRRLALCAPGVDARDLVLQRAVD
jgi:hypothetical protein